MARCLDAYKANRARGRQVLSKMGTRAAAETSARAAAIQEKARREKAAQIKLW